MENRKFLLDFYWRHQRGEGVNFNDIYDDDDETDGWRETFLKGGVLFPFSFLFSGSLIPRKSNEIFTGKCARLRRSPKNFFSSLFFNKHRWLSHPWAVKVKRRVTYFKRSLFLKRYSSKFLKNELIFVNFSL